jgi:hypothetical protein
MIENFNDYGEENQKDKEEENLALLNVSQEGKVFMSKPFCLERKELINKNKSKLEKLLC